MKSGLLALLLVFSGASARADLQACPNSVKQNPKLLKALRFLTSIQGKFQVGRCFVELAMCTESENDGDDSVVGDLMVTDAHGEKFYVLLDLSLLKTEDNRDVVDGGGKRLHYESLDHIPDPQNGRYENYRLEILKSPDLTRVDKFDLGVYTSRLHLQYPALRPGRSYWVNCGLP